MLPKMVNLNEITYDTVGMVKLNNSAFLIAANGNSIIKKDFTQIEQLRDLKSFKTDKPTSVELLFMDFVIENIQSKIENGSIVGKDGLKNALSDINRYVNTHPELLTNMAELDGKDKIVEEQENNLLDYFEEKMSANPYFQKEQVELRNDNQVLVQHNFEEVKPYDEQTVDMVLKRQIENPNPNFDISGFMNQFFDKFTLKQIDTILNGNFNLDENQVLALNQKKDAMKVYDALQTAEIQKTEEVVKENRPEKRIRFLRKANNKEAAFVDTLLLSFTVGTICGVYLMYFILTIM